MKTNIKDLPPVPDGFSEPIKGKLDHPPISDSEDIIRYTPGCGEWDAAGWRGVSRTSNYSIRLGSPTYEKNKAMFDEKGHPHAASHRKGGSTMSATTGHPHAALMLEYAKDWAETKQPWLKWRRRQVNSVGDWFACHDHPKWLEYYDYERIPTPPATLFINGIEVPEPVREPLNDGERYFVTDLRRCYGSEWDNDEYDSQRLRAGIIHITGSSAEIHRKALLSCTAKEEA